MARSGAEVGGLEPAEGMASAAVSLEAVYKH